MFLEKYPNAKMDLVDISEDMFNIAKKRFEGNNNLNFYLKNILDFKPEKYKKYDVIISSLAIHHLPDEKKIELYDNIFQWLNHDGLFVNAEIIAGETEYLNNMYEEWQFEIANNLDAEGKQKAIERLKLDIRTPVSKQLKWLKNAGFSNFDCIYKAYCFGVLWAKK